jgi:hypothetical protein
VHPAIDGEYPFLGGALEGKIVIDANNYYTHNETVA